MDMFKSEKCEALEYSRPLLGHLIIGRNLKKVAVANFIFWSTKRPVFGDQRLLHL